MVPARPLCPTGWWPEGGQDSDVGSDIWMQVGKQVEGQGALRQRVGENPAEGLLSGWGRGCRIFQGGASQSASLIKAEGWSCS